MSVVIYLGDLTWSTRKAAVSRIGCKVKVAYFSVHTLFERERVPGTHWTRRCVCMCVSQGRSEPCGLEIFILLLPGIES
jgi:hypothetical protein